MRHTAVAALVLATWVTPNHARATTLIVPDQVPSIQSALAAHVDTVLIQPGVYAETPTVSRPVSLLGIAADRSGFPRLAGLRIQVERTAVLPPLFTFQRLVISSQVVTISDRGNCDFSFLQCALLGGIVDSSQYMDTGNISLLKCQLEGDVMLMAHGWIRVDSCDGSGHVLGCGAEPVLAVQGCHFEGDGTGYAIGSCDLAGAEIGGNVVRNYAVGITVYGSVLVRDNVVEDCGSIGVAVGGNSVRLERNVIRRGGQGIDAYAANTLSVLGNTVVAAAGTGISIHEGDPVEVSANVVVGCSRDGVIIGDQSFRVWSAPRS